MLKKNNKPITVTHADMVSLEWDYEMNNNIGIHPDDYSYGSHMKAWWHCDNPLHDSYQSTIKDKIKGHGCPQCSGRKPVKDVNDLETLAPSIARQWYQPLNDYEHIGYPSDYTVSSGVKAWFWCGNPNHKPWKAVISSRQHRGCPYCHHKKPVKGVNDLETLYPLIAMQWYQPLNDYEHIGYPYDYSAHSSKKAWFWCGNPKHEPFKCSIGERTGKDNHKRSCVQCWQESHSSKGENEMINVIINMFPYYADEIINNRSISIKKASHGKVNSNMQLDVYIPSLHVAIEYNGIYWHSDEAISKRLNGKYKTAADYHNAKRKYCKQACIQLLMIWEQDWIDDKKSCVSMIKTFIISQIMQS